MNNLKECKHCKVLLMPAGEEQINGAFTPLGYCCYHCNKMNYTWRGRLQSILWTIQFYLTIFFVPWSQQWKDWWGYIFEEKDCDVSWFRVIICRWRNHPYNVVWYNFQGTEPNMRCSNCRDDLG